MKDNSEINGCGSMNRVLLNQIQTTPNRRILSSMKSFRVESDTPDQMNDMLRRLEKAESRVR